MKIALFSRSISIYGLVAAMAACSDEPLRDREQDVTRSDPVIARALNDPLMIDPDLAWVNEANAAIAYPHNHALPTFSADPQATALARDAARIELAEDGVIEELPVAETLPDSFSLNGLSTLREVLTVAEMPASCGEGATDDLAWAAQMPASASIMPHGMVQQAAGSDANECQLRVVRYLTQANAKDALQYHYTRGTRSDLEMSYLSGASDVIKGEKAGEKMFADVSDAPGDLRIVTLVHWRN